jgi:hypothetical protein
VNRKTFAHVLVSLLVGGVVALSLASGGASRALADGIAYVQGIAANGSSAANTRPVLIAGSDGTNARSLLMDSVGQARTAEQGVVGVGASLSGFSPVYTGGIDTSGNARGILTDTSGRVVIAGYDTANAVTRPLPIVSAGSVNTSPFLAIGGTDGGAARAFLTDASGRSIVTTTGLVNGSGSVAFSAVDSAGRAQSGDTNKATYRAAGTWTPTATSATDIFVFTGSGSKTVYVRRVACSFTATAATVIPVILVKRSTAPTGGSASSMNQVPLDDSDAAGTCSPGMYTANPTVGTIVGNVGAATYTAGASGSIVSPPLVWEFAPHGLRKGIKLNATTKSLSINLNSTSTAGITAYAEIEWTEE